MSCGFPQVGDRVRSIRNARIVGTVALVISMPERESGGLVLVETTDKSLLWEMVVKLVPEGE
jgi:hypothetical protein